jgi:hypothetical protein
MKKISITLLALVASSIAATAVTLTSFGNVSAPTFTVDGGFTSFTPSQNASSLDLSGSDNQELFGTFTSVNLGALSESDLVVNGSASTAPASTFSITLTDGGFNSAEYSSTSWASLSGGATLSFVQTVGAFNWSDVQGVFLSGGGGGDGVSFNLSGLSTVPEPSTYAALAGLCALGYVMVRRRK